MKPKPKSGTEPLRKFPYYKLQYWEKRVSAWMDVQKRFDTTEALLAHAKSTFNSQQSVRIMIVEGYGSRRIFKDSATVDTLDLASYDN